MGNLKLTKKLLAERKPLFGTGFFTRTTCFPGWIF